MHVFLKLYRCLSTRTVHRRPCIRPGIWFCNTPFGGVSGRQARKASLPTTVVYSLGFGVRTVTENPTQWERLHNKMLLKWKHTCITRKLLILTGTCLISLQYKHTFDVHFQSMHLYIIMLNAYHTLQSYDFKFSLMEVFGFFILFICIAKAFFVRIVLTCWKQLSLSWIMWISISKSHLIYHTLKISKYFLLSCKWSTAVVH